MTMYRLYTYDMLGGCRLYVYFFRQATPFLAPLRLGCWPRPGFQFYCEGAATALMNLKKKLFISYLQLVFFLSSLFHSTMYAPAQIARIVYPYRPSLDSRRGHRCLSLPPSPGIPAFIFVAHRVRYSYLFQPFMYNTLQ